MSGVLYRFIIGSFLLVFLVLEVKAGIIAVLALLAFEAVTNLLLSHGISKIRYGKTNDLPPNEKYKFNFEAERVMRLLVILFVSLGSYLLPNHFWFLPWFVSFMLFLSGITRICVMTLFLKRLGFK